MPEPSSLIMKIVIFGATGLTGQQLVQQALELGHEVTAFVRNPQGLQTTHVNFNIFKGDLFDPQIVSAAVKKHAVVISALGVKPTVKDKDIPPLRSEGTKNIIAAMKQHGVKRLLVISSQGAGDSKPRSGLFGKVIVPLFLKNRFAEVEKQERLVFRERPRLDHRSSPAIDQRPLTGMYKVGAFLKIGLMDSIARADVAHFILKEMIENNWLQQAVDINPNLNSPVHPSSAAVNQ